jgi:hypothetical protein
VTRTETVEEPEEGNLATGFGASQYVPRCTPAPGGQPRGRGERGSPRSEPGRTSGGQVGRFRARRPWPAGTGRYPSQRVLLPRGRRGRARGRRPDRRRPGPLPRRAGGQPRPAPAPEPARRLLGPLARRVRLRPVRRADADGADRRGAGRQLPSPPAAERVDSREDRARARGQPGRPASAPPTAADEWAQRFGAWMQSAVARAGEVTLVAHQFAGPVEEERLALAGSLVVAADDLVPGRAPLPTDTPVRIVRTRKEA